MDRIFEVDEDARTMRVQRSLNQRRAITLCCTAKSPRSAASMTMACASGPRAAPSSVVGTMNPPTNATA